MRETGLRLSSYAAPSAFAVTRGGLDTPFFSLQNFTMPSSRPRQLKKDAGISAWSWRTRHPRRKPEVGGRDGLFPCLALAFRWACDVED